MHDLSYTQIQFQIPIPWLNIISISSKQMTYRKWPNPISNPIHGFDNIHDLRYKPIQFQIPIPSRTTLSISSNKTAHRKWPDPISNPIYGHTTFDIFEHMHDLRYTQSNFKSQYLGLPSYQWIQLTNRNHCPRVPLHESQRLKYPKIKTGHTLSYVKLNLK